MNKCMMAAITGFAVGMYVGYAKEDELHDFCRQSHRTKKKAVRKMQDAYDSMCNCMDID